MTISSHPDIATLMTCSAGSTPEALCAVVTSHLSMCPSCMGELTSMESIGVALFEELDPTSTDVASGQVSDTANAKSDLSQESPRAIGGDVPTPLVGVIGSDLDALDWQPLAPGIWNVAVPMTSKTKGDLRLIKLEPGYKLPDHEP